MHDMSAPFFPNLSDSDSNNFEKVFEEKLSEFYGEISVHPNRSEIPRHSDDNDFLKDLGCDSLDLMSFVHKLEVEFGVSTGSFNPMENTKIGQIKGFFFKLISEDTPSLVMAIL